MRLDVMDDLVEHLNAGRLRIVSKEPWELNGKPMVRVVLEEVHPSDLCGRCGGPLHDDYDCEAP
jgi:hypothetical protein